MHLIEVTHRSQQQIPTHSINSLFNQKQKIRDANRVFQRRIKTSLVHILLLLDNITNRLFQRKVIRVKSVQKQQKVREV